MEAPRYTISLTRNWPGIADKAGNPRLAPSGGREEHGKRGREQPNRKQTLNRQRACYSRIDVLESEALVRGESRGTRDDLKYLLIVCQIAEDDLVRAGSNRIGTAIRMIRCGDEEH